VTIPQVTSGGSLVVRFRKRINEDGRVTADNATNYARIGSGTGGTGKRLLPTATAHPSSLNRVSAKRYMGRQSVRLTVTTTAAIRMVAARSRVKFPESVA